MMNDNFSQLITQQLNAIKSQGRYRIFANLLRQKSKFPRAIYRPDNNCAPREVIIWCSNDYLGMGQNQSVIDAMTKALNISGSGAGGTRNISGNHHYIVELEKKLAKFHEKSASLVFSSGYVANQTSLEVLISKTDSYIFSDSLNHNSMISGIRQGNLGTNKPKFIFEHNNMDILAGQLQSVPIDAPKIIAFESVYSMDGAFGNIAKITQLAKKYNAITYCDEVHAIGLYGDSGAGVAQQLGLMNEIDIIQGTLGKSVGLMGGYIAADAQIIDFVRSFGAGFIFTTTIPPHVAAGANQSLDLIADMQHERQLILNNAQYIRDFCAKNAIQYIDGQSHIVPILINDALRCKEISARLLNEFNIFVQPINYPTVPQGTERLRITNSPFHSQQMIDELCSALKICLS